MSKELQVKQFKQLHPGWSDITDAAWQTVHEFEYRGKEGAAAWSLLTTKSQTTISNEVNPDQAHKLSLEDAQQYVLLSGDTRILQVFAKNTGYALVKIPNNVNTCSKDTLKAFAKWQADLGATNQAIQSALVDGKITDREFSEITTKSHQHMTAFFEFLQSLEPLRG